VKPGWKGILILLCLFAPFMAHYSALIQLKQQIKHEVKNHLIHSVSKNELVLLKFSPQEHQTELNWEHSMEFEYNGEMYDVVQKFFLGDTIAYYCWWDNEETRLNQELSGIVNLLFGKHPKGQKNHQLLYDFLRSLYFGEESDPRFIVSVVFDKLKIIDSTGFPESESEPPAPPPDSFC
jgi:hypothetical protein